MACFFLTSTLGEDHWVIGFSVMLYLVIDVYFVNSVTNIAKLTVKFRVTGNNIMIEKRTKIKEVWNKD